MQVLAPSTGHPVDTQPLPSLAFETSGRHGGFSVPPNISRPEDFPIPPATSSGAPASYVLETPSSAALPEAVRTAEIRREVSAALSAPLTALERRIYDTVNVFLREALQQQQEQLLTRCEALVTDRFRLSRIGENLADRVDVLTSRVDAITESLEAI